MRVSGRARNEGQEAGLRLVEAAGSGVGQLGEVGYAGVSIEHRLHRTAERERIAEQANGLVGSRQAGLGLRQRGLRQQRPSQGQPRKTGKLISRKHKPSGVVVWTWLTQCCANGL